MLHNEQLIKIIIIIKFILLSTPAVVTVEIYTLFEPEIGLQYNMSCIVTGAEQLNPNISYQWYKDEELFFGENQSHWTRQSLRHDDAGDYKCVVNISSNVLGRGHVTKASEAFRLCIPCKFLQKVDIVTYIISVCNFI